MVISVVKGGSLGCLLVSLKRGNFGWLILWLNRGSFE